MSGRVARQLHQPADQAPIRHLRHRGDLSLFSVAVVLRKSNSAGQRRAVSAARKVLLGFAEDVDGIPLLVDGDPPRGLIGLDAQTPTHLVHVADIKVLL